MFLYSSLPYYNKVIVGVMQLFMQLLLISNN